MAATGQRSTDPIIIQMAGQLGALEESARTGKHDRDAIWTKLDETNKTLRDGFQTLQTALQPLALLNQTVAQHALTLDKHDRQLEGHKKRLWVFSGAAGALGVTGGAAGAAGSSKVLAWIGKVFGGGIGP